MKLLEGVDRKVLSLMRDGWIIGGRMNVTILEYLCFMIERSGLIII